MEMEPLAFIKTIRDSFIGSEIVYTRGSCYKFYKILKSVYPQSVAYNNSNHVITLIDGVFYDITGEVKPDGHISVDEHYSHEKLDTLKWVPKIEWEFESMEEKQDGDWAIWNLIGEDSYGFKYHALTHAFAHDPVLECEIEDIQLIDF